MDLSSFVAPVTAAFGSSRRRWRRHDLAARVWSGDPTVWSADPSTPELSDRLGWLSLHHSMRSSLDEIRAVAAAAADDGVRHVVLCGMGGSSLAPEVFASVLGGSGPELTVLDSTHPRAVTAVAGRVEPGSTLFVISSKSGTTLETLSFFRYFWQQTGGDGSRFVAVTDPGSPLERLADEHGFRAVMTAPTDVGGRFSALTHFGLVPAALCGIDVEALLDAVDRPAAGHREVSDPGIALGLAWGALAMGGRDKLTMLTSPSLAAFPAWMEQLIAESLGKDRTGIVPVADEPLGPPSVYGADRALLVYKLEGEDAPGAGLGLPALTVTLPDRSAVAARMFEAEMATAVAGELLGVHPFDQPDVEAAKQLARQAMSGDLDVGGAATVPPEDGTRAVLELLDGVTPGDYVGLHAYLAPSAELWDRLTGMRVAIRDRTGSATTLGWGPRFLHSTGQLHKGGPDTGVFIQLVDSPGDDVPVPETDHTFGQIVTAQAAGDHKALLEAGRRVVRIDVGDDPGAVVSRLEGALR